MSSRQRWLIAAALLAAVLVTWRWMVGRSAQSSLDQLRAQGLPTNPEELDRWYRPVPTAENLAAPIVSAAAAYRAPRASASVPFSGALELPPHPVDPALLSIWRKEVDDNQEALTTLARARGRTASRYPVNFRAGPNTMLPHLSGLKGLAQLSALAAVTEAESGNAAASQEHLMDIVMVARSLEPEPTLISQLVRYAILRIAAKAATQCFGRVSFDETQLKNLQEAFAAADTPHGFQTGIIGEIALNVGGFSQFVTGPGGGGGNISMPRFAGLLYEATGLRAADQKFAVDRLRELLEASKQPYPESLKLADGVADRVEHERLRFAHGFKIISTMLLPSMNKSMEKNADCAAATRSVIVACAVERHRLQHNGKPPGTLAELVPAQLAAVPVDPFNGEPLHYIQDGASYIVYSIGTDRQDNQGQLRTSAPSQRKGGGLDTGFEVTH